MQEQGVFPSWKDSRVNKMGLSMGGNALGTNITQDELSGVRTLELLETLSPSGVATISTAGTLKAFDEYVIDIETIQGADGDEFRMRINADSTASHYESVYVNSTPALAKTGGETSAYVGELHTRHCLTGQLNINGISGVHADGRCGIAMHVANSVVDRGLHAWWNGGNATQITSFTFLGGSNFTGKIRVYGVVR